MSINECLMRETFNLSLVGTYIAKDGVSPTAVIEQTEDGAVIKITDVGGTTEATIKNGRNPADYTEDDLLELSARLAIGDLINDLFNLTLKAEAVKAAVAEIEKKGYLKDDESFWNSGVWESINDVIQLTCISYNTFEAYKKQAATDLTTATGDKLTETQVQALIDAAIGGVEDGTY